MRSPRDEGAAGAIASVWRALVILGIDASRQELADACRGDYSLVSLAARLRERGVRARVVLVSPDALAALGDPALIAMRDGRVALLTAARSNDATFVLESGEQVRVGRSELRATVGDRAIVLAPPARRGGTFAALGSAFAASRTGRTAAAHVIALSAILPVLGAAVPLLAAFAIDEAVPDGARHWLATIAGGAVLLGAHAAWAQWLRDCGVRHVEARLRSAALSRAFAATVHLPFERLDRCNTGELVRGVECAEAAAQGVTTVARGALDALFALAYLAVLAWLVPTAGIVALLLVLALFALAVAIGHRLARDDDAILAASARQRGALYEIFSSVLTLRAAVAERRAIARWLDRLLDEQTLTLGRQDAAARFKAITQLVTHAATIALVAAGGYECLAGRLSIGSLLAALQACSAYFAEVERLVQLPLQAATAARQLAYADRLLGDAPPIAAPRPTSAVMPHEGDDAIVLDDVWFRHGPEAPWVLQRFSMQVRRGEITRIAWPSGKGKTTLLRLIAGLYAPERGLITVAGRDPRGARHLVTYLPQTTALFPGSIMDNLRILSAGADTKRIHEATRATGLEEVVATWPMGLETRVATNGANLSSGQRQLVAVTAALASDRPILLLDESLANLDRIARARLREGALFAGRTVLAVTHEESAASARPIASNDDVAVLDRAGE